MKNKIFQRYFTLFFCLCIITFLHYSPEISTPLKQKLTGKRTIYDVLDLYSSKAESRLKPSFNHAQVDYPPPKIAFLCLKQNKLLEVWAEQNNQWWHIKNYPIKGASGQLGPKLREGDRQVPEGIYHIEGLNPNSSYHLSMKLNYPNNFDRKYAQKEGRATPGSNIFIHGKTGSTGCIAMGDPAIEDLFVLVSKVGKNNVTVIISPYDPRKQRLPYALSESPSWLPELYDMITSKFVNFHEKRT